MEIHGLTEQRHRVPQLRCDGFTDGAGTATECVRHRLVDGRWRCWTNEPRLVVTCLPTSAIEQFEVSDERKIELVR